MMIDYIGIVHDYLSHFYQIPNKIDRYYGIIMRCNPCLEQVFSCYFGYM